MAGLGPTLTKTEFSNWVKGCLALLFTKDGLTDFVSMGIDQQHQRIIQLVQTAGMQNKCNCTIKSLPRCTENKNHSHIVPGPRHLCSRGICNILMDEICKDHRYRGPSWKNTDPQKWCADAYEVAKCYMPDGYSNKISLTETDFNGILAVVINNMSFTTLIQANLETKPNICLKARRVGRDIRHTKDYLLSDNELKDYIDDLINLLCDPAFLMNDPSAQDAVRKLKMLKANDLTIHEKDITEALRDNIRETLSDELSDFLQTINKHFSQHQIDSVAEIDRIAADRKRELDEHTNKHMDDITRLVEQKRQEIVLNDRTKETKGYEENLKVLQKDLMTFYKNNSDIPISFLVEENVVSLLELYVKPPMSAVDLQQWHESPDKISVNNYKEMLFQSDQSAFRNVYVTAEAGVGKTSLCNHIGLAWYHSHDGTLPQSFLSEDVNAMKLFDFCFIISLREISHDFWKVEDLIYDFLEENLPDRPNLRDCINNILNSEACSKLIVLDGLDEWVHPIRGRKRKHIPHAKCWNNCTIITTTRPWKFDEIRLPLNKIDRHIEISQLDEESLSELAQNAIKLLNDRSKSRKTMSVEDFNDKVTDVLKFGDFRSIPYIHLQTVCLWYDDQEIGQSKFEICTNIVKLILKRGLEKRLEIHDLDPAIKRLEHILQNKVEQIVQISDFLRSLSKLAFYALFGETLPTTVIFDEDKALEHIGSKIEFELYLKLGLLSQKKSRAFVSVRKSNISFPHKTLQEYFAAMYMYNNPEKNNTYKTVRNKCTSIQSILEMWNVFTFLTGFNPGLYTSTISNILSGPPTESSDMESVQVEVDCFLSSDAVVKKFRNGSCLYFMHDPSAYNAMFAFQTMQADCMHEIEVKGQDDCFPPIADIIINNTSKTKKYFIPIKNMTKNNQSNIKAISVQQVNEEECKNVLENLEIHLLRSLEMLQLWADVKQEDLEQILRNNLRTLKSVDISHVQYKNDIHNPQRTPFSTKCIDAITKMPNLTIFNLERISLPQNELKKIVNFVSHRKELTHIGLMHITCIKKDKSVVKLDLSRHEHLLGICLHTVDINKLYVNTKNLEVLMIGLLPKDTASACLKQIPYGTLIHTLSCRKVKDEDLSIFLEVIKRCWKVQKIYFLGTSFGNRELHLSPIMQNLEFIDIHRSDITCSALVRLTNSVSLMTQIVNISLDGCTVSPVEEYMMLKEKIREDKKFRVQFDDRNQRKREEFRFQKLKSEDSR